MMDTEQLRHLAHLARLQLDPSEETEMQRHLGKVLHYFEQLNEVDTTDTQPMQRPIELCNVLRDDLSEPAFEHSIIQDLTSGTSDLQEGALKIPKVLDPES